MDKLQRLMGLTVRRTSLATWDGFHPPPAEGGNVGVTLPSEHLRKLFDIALPDVRKNPWSALRNGGRATFLRTTDPEDIEAVRSFFECVASCIIIEDLTDGSFALAMHQELTAGRLIRTEVGQLVRAAKPYGAQPTKANRAAARALSERMSDFAIRAPWFSGIDGVVAVPSSDPSRAYSLPRMLADGIAKALRVDDISPAVTKLKPTKELKGLPRSEKARALLGTLSMDTSAVHGASALIVDDLYQSGTTMNTVALELLEAGAAATWGLVATKTLRNDDNADRHRAAKEGWLDGDEPA